MQIVKRITIAAVFLLMGLSAGVSLSFGQVAGDSFQAKVQDASDRMYEQTLGELIDRARVAIVISLHRVVLRPDGAVASFIKGLQEALERGVIVEIYLNTRFDGKKENLAAIEEPFRSLMDQGADVYLISQDKEITDNSIIVDGRFIVEGSLPWDDRLIRKGFGSVTVIDSAGLASMKLDRLSRVPLVGEEAVEEEATKTPVPQAVIIPEGIPVSKALLTENDFFSTMANLYDAKPLDVYLVLLQESARLHERDFFVSVESIALSLKAEGEWTTVAERRQVIKTLRKLYYRYHLIDVSFRHERDAWVSMKQLPGETFYADPGFFTPAIITKLSPPAKVMALVKMLLRAEGKDISSLSPAAIADRFHLDPELAKKGLAELKGTKY